MRTTRKVKPKRNRAIEVDDETYDIIVAGAKATCRTQKAFLKLCVIASKTDVKRAE